MKLNPKLVVILATLFTSFSAIFVRYSTAPSMTLAAYRMAFSALILLPMVIKNCKNEFKALDKKTFLLCCLSGISLGFHFATYFESLKHTSVASAVVLVDTQVIFVAFIMLLVIKEKIPKKGIIGIILAIIGSIVIAMVDSSAPGGNVLFGDLLALAGSVFFAVYTCIGYVARRNLSTTAYTFVIYSVACLTLTIVSVISGTGMVGFDPINILLALCLAVFCTMLGHSLFSWSFKYVSAAFVSTATLLEPVFSTILAVFLFKEIPVLVQVIGIIIIIAGVGIYSSAKDNQ